MQFYTSDLKNNYIYKSSSKGLARRGLDDEAKISAGKDSCETLTEQLNYKRRPPRLHCESETGLHNKKQS